jgi:guanyl-specific ribonuclease Sa
VDSKLADSERTGRPNSKYSITARTNMNDLAGSARTIFSKIGGGEPEPYNDDMCQYITFEEFVKENQQAYLRRSRDLKEMEDINTRKIESENWLNGSD